MTKKIILDVLFYLSLGSIIYGMFLMWKPLGFISSGFIVVGLLLLNEYSKNRKKGG